jgi:UDPglucose 6-dehydrogenase
MIITDLPSAEVIKYASNAFLAAKISFINAIANLCEAAGADVSQVTKGMGLDSRIGTQFLQPGLGYGGSCFPKDVDSLIHTAGDLGYDFKLLKSVVEINRERSLHLFDMIKKSLAPLDDRTVAVLGLAFKPNTDDMREAKSLEVIRLLHAAGAQIRAYDPVAMDNARPLMPDGVVFSDSAYAAADGADAVALLTEWNEFKFLNLERLRRLLRQPVIFDGRNLYEPDRMRRLGFEYHSIGRKPVLPA